MKNTQPWPLNLKIMFWVIASAGTLAIVTSVIFALLISRDSLLKEAQTIARRSIQKDILYHSWNARHEGVYVYQESDQSPRPDSSIKQEYDTTTPSLTRLTLVDPTSMVKQVFEATEEEYGIKSHITSLSLQDSSYLPDVWETDALTAIQRGSAEFSSLELVDEEEYLNLMLPLKVEPECVPCHRDRGFEVGNIRGGIDVHVPMNALNVQETKKLLTMGITHGVVWLIGIIGFTLGMLKLRKQDLERRQAHEELKSTRNKLQRLLEASPSMVYTCEATGNFDATDISENIKSILGYDQEDFLSPGFWAEHLHPDDAPLVFENIGQIFKKDRHSHQYRFRHKDGTWHWMDDDLSLVRDQNGEPLEMIGYWSDITERKQAEKALAESNSLRELLLDIITHDLKNPAGVIYALSETARKDLPENKFLEAIYTGSGRLIEVLNQTTILSQATFGENIPKETLSLNKLLQETADEFASPLSTAEMDLVVATAPDVLIEANPLIGEVFKNYISNAIKYASDGKRIVIETFLEDQTVIVYVKDFGKTIAKADREHVFERQVQLEEGEKRGRGLGLAIVKRIALAHDGEVWVEPITPVGNSFCLRIPI